MAHIELTIHTEPVAQGRPRFSTQQGLFRTYDPVRSRTYKLMIRRHAIANGTKPLSGALSMTVIVYRTTPKSWSQKKRTAAERNEIKPTGAPDIDNYVKAVKDALNGIAYGDDSQVCILHAEKRYSEQPRIEIHIEEANHGTQ